MAGRIDVLALHRGHFKKRNYQDLGVEVRFSCLGIPEVFGLLALDSVLKGCGTPQEVAATYLLR